MFGRNNSKFVYTNEYQKKLFSSKLSQFAYNLDIDRSRAFFFQLYIQGLGVIFTKH